MYRSIKGRGFSDIHLCHQNTPTAKIAEEMKAILPYSKESHALDTLVIAGDWWDKLMPNNHPDVYTAEDLIYYVLYWAKYHDVVLLIVDGTPLHDSTQMRKFLHINEQAKIGAEIHYHEDVVIEYISKLDMHVLFVPDRPRMSPDETLKAVKEQLAINEIDQVDMAVMHGCFKYQLPIISDDHKHDMDEYLALVKGLIIIGHIHQHNPYQRIIPPGSFSRLAHGEEGAKGHIDFVMHPSGDYKVQFVENKPATKYITINLTGLDAEESRDKILSMIKDLPNFSHVRLQAKSGHPIFAEKISLNYKMDYPLFHWTTKVEQEKTEVATRKEIIALQEEYTPLVINQNNILKVVEDKLMENGVPKDTMELSIQLLEGLI